MFEGHDIRSGAIIKEKNENTNKVDNPYCGFSGKI
jgi:hypothetical protein